MVKRPLGHLSLWERSGSQARERVASRCVILIWVVSSVTAKPSPAAETATSPTGRGDVTRRTEARLDVCRPFRANPVWFACLPGAYAPGR